MQIAEINIKDKNYPPLLREISNPPEKIFVRGEFPNFNLPWIAIVGTRKATRDGIELARKVAKALAERGFIIVSGLAMGIDTAAHNGALVGGGPTVAVLGNGIDTIYPAQNENLANKILLNNGAIISEYETDTPAYKNQFLERNRIVAGLCIATIVVEAPQKSGALVTARLAAEAGREVFVFPGLAGHPQYAGSHALIRDGARLVNSIDNILEDLGYDDARGDRSGYPAPRKQNNFSPAEKFSSPSARHFTLGKNQAGAPAGCSSEQDSQSLTNSGDRAERIVSLSAHPRPSGHGVLPKAGRARERRSERARWASEWRVRNNSLGENAQTLLDVLESSKTPLSVDKIIEITKLTPQVVNQIITELIINGIVEETSQGYKIKN